MHPAFEDLARRFLGEWTGGSEPRDIINRWKERWFQELTALSLMDASLAMVIADPVAYRVKQDEFQLRGLLEEVVYAGPENKVIRLTDMGKVTTTSEEGRPYQVYATEISATFLRHTPKE